MHCLSGEDKLTHSSQEDLNNDEVDTDFGNISLGRTAVQRSEIDEYLALPVEQVKDALMWWYEREHVFPRLSRMARDYLSIPGECCLTFSFYWLMLAHSYINSS